MVIFTYFDIKHFVLSSTLFLMILKSNLGDDYGTLVYGNCHST